MLKGRLGQILGWSQPPVPAEVVERIRGWTRAAWTPPADAVIKVNEIICADPACPGTETVVLVMAPGFRTTACKVPKPATEITAEEIAAAIAAQGPLVRTA